MEFRWADRARSRRTRGRRRIVAEAGNLFRSRGYDAVGIAYVMKAAGMTQGGFYKRFASKEALAAEAWGLGFKLSSVIWQRQDKGASPAAAIVDYYLAPKPAEHRCPMVAHGEEVGRMEEDCALRGVYADGAKAHYETFMDAAKGSMPEDRAKPAVRGNDWRQYAEPGRRRRSLGRHPEEVRQGPRRRVT